MNFTSDYLKQAEDCIKSVFLSKRVAQVQANGNIKADFKDDKSVVTAMDKEMELELKKALLKIDGGIGFEGEEFGAFGSRKTFWLVDPVDGTESFVRGLPYFRNIATFIDNGQPLLAVIYRPVTNDFFIAKKGGGAYKNDQRLKISQRPLSRTRLELWTKFRTPGLEPLLKAIEGKVENIRFMDEFLYVAEAKLDAHLAYRPVAKPWDHAPRMLLLSEAGAKVANPGSDTYNYKNGLWLAANPEVFDELMPIINKVTKKVTA